MVSEEPRRELDEEQQLIAEATRELHDDFMGVGAFENFLKDNGVDRGKASQIALDFFDVANAMGNDNPRLRDEFTARVLAGPYGLTDKLASQIFEMLRVFKENPYKSIRKIPGGGLN